MKNKLTIIIIIIFSSIFAVGALASSTGILDPVFEARLTDIEFSKYSNDAVQEIAELKNSGVEVQEHVEAYIYFISSLNPTKNEKAFIDLLIAEGYNTSALITIFEFWKDTPEDIEIIKDVYSFMPQELEIKYWVDDAFIQLDKAGKTKVSYSNLSLEEVEAYQTQGIDLENIRVADKISRAGVKDIELILDEIKEDKPWFEIMSEVYSFSSPIFAKVYRVDFSNIDNPYEIFASMSLSEKSGIPVEYYLSSVVNGSSSIEKNNVEVFEKVDSAIQTFEEQGLWNKEEQKMKGETIL